MQLTRFTDLGLRIVMRLAAEGLGEQLHTGDLATELSASYAHAAKVVARLVSLGVVESVRGRHGGVSITQDGLCHSVGWLARRLEGDGEVVDCEGAHPCPVRTGCRLRGALRIAQEAFFCALDSWTLAEMARSPAESVLLSLSPPSRALTC